MQEPKQHTRVSLSDCHPSPTNGIYVTHQDLRKYGIFAGLLFAVLTVLALFRRKD